MHVLQTNEYTAWVAIEEGPFLARVELEYTLCNYGTSRAWWRCPECKRRCALIYLDGGLRCRICSGLTYVSSQSSRWDRKVQKYVEVGRRIGLEPGAIHPVKPRGMHWQTFHRLAEDYEAAVVAALGSGEARSRRSRRLDLLLGEQ